MNLQSTNETKTKTFWLLIALTALYFFGFYLLVQTTAGCMIVPRSEWTVLAIVERNLGCRTINELGDALAGAFAPVAFLWLAGAVFIQSKELEAQRMELNETQEVMRQQVKESQASTALFREQTEILRLQQLQRNEEKADLAFEHAVRALTFTLRDMKGIEVQIRHYASWSYHEGLRQGFSSSSHRPKWFPDHQNEHCYLVSKDVAICHLGKSAEPGLFVICREIVAGTKKAQASIEQATTNLVRGNRDAIELKDWHKTSTEIAQLEGVLHQLIMESEHLSEGMRRTFDSSQVFVAANALSHFTEHAERLRERCIAHLRDCFDFEVFPD